MSPRDGIPSKIPALEEMTCSIIYGLVLARVSKALRMRSTEELRTLRRVTQCVNLGWRPLCEAEAVDGDASRVPAGEQSSVKLFRSENDDLWRYSAPRRCADARSPLAFATELDQGRRPNWPVHASNQATVDAIAHSSAEHAPQLDTKTYGYWPSC